MENGELKDHQNIRLLRVLLISELNFFLRQFTPGIIIS
jgi:hypothetical protein